MKNTKLKAALPSDLDFLFDDEDEKPSSPVVEVNVLKTVVKTLGEGGHTTRNTVLNQTVVPLKTITLQKLKSLMMELGKHKWERHSFSRYSVNNVVHYSISLIRDLIDDSGFNCLVISTELNIGILQKVAKGVTILHPHMLSSTISHSNFVVRAFSELFAVYAVNSGKRIYIKSDGTSGKLSWTHDLGRAELYFCQDRARSVASQYGLNVDRVKTSE